AGLTDRERLRCRFGDGKVECWWMLLAGDEFYSKQVRSGYMDEKNKEHWDRLENEPERAYRAFESYRNLPSGERTLIAAYRGHVGNPDAAKPSDTWSRWCGEFAWRERAAAYDDHFESMRREAYERVIEEEAQREAREIERMRGRFNELMTVAYEKVIDYLESEDFVQQMRPQDAINIMKLHLEVTQKLVDTNTQAIDSVVDLSEDELRELDRIMGDIDAEEAHEEGEAGSDGGEEGPEDSEGVSD
ncbi:MAG: hypothetical protein M3317_11240, partial [Actinomycetota bacterium]|nr:hypothetical protein [Actinomycetota bacterium]